MPLSSPDSNAAVVMCFSLLWIFKSHMTLFCIVSIHINLLPYVLLFLAFHFFLAFQPSLWLASSARSTSFDISSSVDYLEVNSVSGCLQILFLLLRETFLLNIEL